MTEQTAATWFAGLGVSEKTIVLCRLVYEFTLVIRVASHPSIDEAGARAIHGVGELTHQIMPYLMALNAGEKERYQDEDLIEMLFEASAYYGFESQFLRAWDNARTVVSRQAK